MAKEEARTEDDNQERRHACGHPCDNTNLRSGLGVEVLRGQPNLDRAACMHQELLDFRKRLSTQCDAVDEHDDVLGMERVGLSSWEKSKDQHQ
jgi:hypothetical protein